MAGISRITLGSLLLLLGTAGCGGGNPDGTTSEDGTELEQRESALSTQRNILPNGGFENLGTGWTLDPIVDFVGAAAYQGNYGARETSGSLRRQVPAKPGVRYTASVFTRRVAGLQNAQFDMGFCDAAGTCNIWYSTFPGSSTDWNQLSLTHVSPAGTASMVIAFGNYFGNGQERDWDVAKILCGATGAACSAARDCCSASCDASGACL